MEHWVIYHQATDRPKPYTVRRWLIERNRPVPTEDVQDFDTLEQARAVVPPGAICLARYAEDDPAIVEVWL